MTSVHWVQDWLWNIEGIVPPLCVELVLKDESSYHLHSVLEKDDETRTAVVRIWDFRAFGDGDFEGLKERLNRVGDRSELATAENVHPKLDWANVYLHLDDIAYCIEWHDRLWPMEERPRMGFEKQ